MALDPQRLGTVDAVRAPVAVGAVGRRGSAAVVGGGEVAGTGRQPSPAGCVAEGIAWPSPTLPDLGTPIRAPLQRRSMSVSSSTTPSSSDLATSSPGPLQSDLGKTTIADRVVQKIVGLAAREVP